MSMAKKFFYDRVYNSRRTITNIIIISVCVIGIIICFIVVSNFQGKDTRKKEKVVNIKNEVTVEVNESYNNDIFFSKLDNIDVDDIKVEYEESFNIGEPGTYSVTITIGEETYDSNITVVDTKKPVLTVQDVTITEGNKYSITDFVTSCTDNSEKDCVISYGESLDEDGNKVDFSSYSNPETYTIKISAKDPSGNEAVEDAKLVINAKKTVTPKKEEPVVKPKVCKYGNDEYDTDKYLMASKITSTGCALSLNLYKDTSTSESINKMMETETTRIKKDVDDLNLKGTFALSRKITAIVNNSGSGIVGFELSMVVTITNDNKTSTVADYKINSKGERVFTENPYDLVK
jgi:ABC-type Na+ efflux pump permease subunit